MEISGCLFWKPLTHLLPNVGNLSSGWTLEWKFIMVKNFFLPKPNPKSLSSINNPAIIVSISTLNILGLPICGPCWPLSRPWSWWMNLKSFSNSSDCFFVRKVIRESLLNIALSFYTFILFTKKCIIHRMRLYVIKCI